MDETGKYIHDAYMARSERTEKRLWIIIIILIVMLFGTNGAWFYYESQFEDVVTTTIEAEQDGEGYNIVGGGDVVYEPTSESYYD